MSDLESIARQLRQRLELYRLAGWDVPLRRTRITPDPSALPPTGPGPGEPAVDGSRRLSLLEPLRVEVAACRRCPLCRHRTQTVFGTGDPAARLVFVGEGPGGDEDREGEPFVGRAGRLLNDIIRAMGLQREQVYIANVVKCRPPANRTPDAGEIGACGGYLRRQLEIIAPEVVVALGRVATQFLLETDQPMGRLRGRFHEVGGLEVLPTYHPAYLLRYPENKRKVWEDIQKVMARLGLQRPPSARRRS